MMVAFILVLWQLEASDLILRLRVLVLAFHVDLVLLVDNQDAPLSLLFAG